MKLELEIRNTVKGIDTPGTLPWLLANAGHVKIDMTKLGNQAAWLIGKDGKPITVLAIRNGIEGDTDGDPSGPIRKAEQPIPDDFAVEFVVNADRNFTKSAWKVICQIINAAVEEMEATVDGIVLEEEDTVMVEVKVVRDETARRLATAACTDGATLPVLSDRLKEIA